MTARGFGVAAAAPAEVFAPLATEAETLGYSTFWVNDTPGSDGLERIKTAAGATKTLRLGIGVIPVDRRPADEIAKRIRDLRLPEDRLIVGIGAGQTRVGSLDLVEGAIATLREKSAASIAVGALGQRMVELSAGHADAVLLNWLTPAWIERSRHWIDSAAAETEFEAIGYVRTALPGASEIAAREAGRYAQLPQYRRHFDAMGVTAFETCVVERPEEIDASLRPYDAVLDETVVRAVAAAETPEEYRKVLQAAAPAP